MTQTRSDDGLDILRSVTRPRRGNGQRVRDAAVLLVVDMAAGRPRVLMGRRHGDMAFMANKVVFPGGRVEPADHRLALAAGLAPGTEAALAQKTPARAAATLPRALALAAIRETAEEAGVYLARPGEAGTAARWRTRSPAWQPFLAGGRLPAVDRVHFFARAITPPGRPRRFDTRFFLADAAHLMAGEERGGDGELGGVAWIGFDEARQADIPPVTRVMLDEAERRLDELAEGAMKRPLPFYYSRHGRFERDWIATGA